MKYTLSLLFLFTIISFSDQVETKEIEKCSSGSVRKSNIKNNKVKSAENLYEQKILKILKKKLTDLKKSKLKNSFNEGNFDSNISKSDIMLKFTFLLNSKGKVIDIALHCSNIPENINKAILNSVMELNFGIVPKDFLEKGLIIGISIPYSYLF
ncbi:hypothetical protein EHQ81_19495 [Leptospira selangorensis]|uniref:TonB C-terminal domain-containing protein n=1 Tax=Leptospira selangorensis TaxID=2484982 RepID=A0A5F2C159_9LEPT|nr:hypothetical protein [Leptospira selangorensis]TGM10262.1 hypothetical protein EHQ81_19495 [Leptospira selangorensis]TGM18945.1 hypothetical protein EHQ82_11245 [Leptospira selangorensis]